MECSSIQPAPDQDQDGTLKGLQTNLVGVYDRILAIQNAAPDDADFCEAACDLQDEFNHLSDMLDDEKLLRTRRLDPLEALPPELWTLIVLEATSRRDPIDMDALFDFTSVSRSWHSKLTSNPLVWTTVVLNPRIPDYAAKAQTCLHLSAESYLYVYTNLNHPEWRSIRPLMLPHLDRIVRLTMQSTNILTDLPPLSKLRLINYRGVYRNPFAARRMEGLDPRSLPAFQEITTGDGWPSPRSRWYPYATDITHHGSIVPADTIAIWKGWSKLKRLRVVEPNRDQYQGKDFVESPIHSLVELSYSGPNEPRALMWLGRSLVTLSMTCYTLERLFDIIHAIRNSHSLRELRLKEGRLRRKSTTTPRGSISQNDLLIPLLNIRKLTLVYSIPGGCSVEWREKVKEMHHVLRQVFLGVERFSLHGGILTDNLLRYISCLYNLRHLVLGPDVVGESKDSTIFDVKVCKRLEYVEWRSVQTLGMFTESQDGQADDSELNNRRIQVGIKRNDTLWDENLARLPIPVMKYPRTVDEWVIELENNGNRMKSLYCIQNLTFSYGYECESTRDLAYLVEMIILRPSNLPNLQKLTINEWMVEWDLLILMLERRNMSSQIDACRIDALHFNRRLPKHLENVLSSLAAGRFFPRDTLAAYSWDAVGDRMFDPQKCVSFIVDCRVAYLTEAIGQDA